MVSVIETYLQTIPQNNPEIVVKVAFFGGSFTGLPIHEQEAYLQTVQPYILQNRIQSIQLSTRPDYITQDILDLLKKYHVSLIELGAQSLDSEVLHLSNRGHTIEDVEKSAALILENGFELGLQMMIGLPGDTIEKSIFTAQKFIELGATYTRIYPTLVIKDTDLEEQFLQNNYQPLTIDEAVAWCKPIYQIFKSHNINILRVGLHPSEGFINKEVLVSGPFHVSFKELVLTAIWKDKLMNLAQNTHSENFTIEVPKAEINYAIGYNSSNKNYLEKQYKKVIFIQV